jgi:hypothetical protein
MPDKGNSLGIDLWMVKQTLQGSGDVPGFIAIDYTIAFAMTSKVKAKGSDAVAGNVEGAGPHGTVIRAQTVTQNSCREWALPLREENLSMQGPVLGGEIYRLRMPFHRGTTSLGFFVPRQ